MTNKITTLNELNELLKSGVITKEEFETLKKEVLAGEIQPTEDKKTEPVLVQKAEKKPDPEKLIWEGSPSQVMGAGAYIALSVFFLICFIGMFAGAAGICITGCILIIVLFIVVRKTIDSHNIRITTHRITEEKGLFSKKTDELELFRVKDIQLDEPFFLRFYNLSNIILVTSDRTHGIQLIPAVEDGKEIREKLRNAIDLRRDAKGVREFDNLL